MSTLRIIGYEKNFQKIKHTEYLREHFHMGLRDGKHATDGVLDGKPLELHVDSATAEQHRRALEALGARVIVVPGEQAAAWA